MERDTSKRTALGDGLDSQAVTAGRVSRSTLYKGVSVAVKIIGPKIGPRPAWAKALIVAEYETDESDISTDYFATRTQLTIPLAWSRHTRDLFSEMRKAAATFKPTAHLGPDCDVWTAQVVLGADTRANGTGYWQGQASPWDRDKTRKFSTKAEAEAYVTAMATPAPNVIYLEDFAMPLVWEITRESIEHREKYSMGSGYYLKGSCGYSTGWTVSKRTYRLEDFDTMVQRDRFDVPAIA